MSLKNLGDALDDKIYSYFTFLEPLNCFLMGVTISPKVTKKIQNSLLFFIPISYICCAYIIHQVYIY